MREINVINTILVPAGMEAEAEKIRAEYIDYFSKQVGFVSSTFYKSINKEADGSTKYVNTVVWASLADFEKAVNQGFQNAEGENRDGMRVLGKGFPEPIIVSPGQYQIISQS